MKCLCMVGSEALGNVVARALFIAPDCITVQVARDDDVPFRMAIVTVHFVNGPVEMVARATVRNTQGKTALLEVMDWDDMLGTQLPSELAPHTH